MALADNCNPDENSRFLRVLLVMTLTWDPPTSIVRMLFVDIRLFVRFLMIATPELIWRSPGPIGRSCSQPFPRNLAFVRMSVVRGRPEIADIGQNASDPKPNSARPLHLSSRDRYWLPRLCALLGAARFACKIQGAVDQTHMAVGLRKISQHTAGKRVELFGEQTHVVAA